MLAARVTDHHLHLALQVVETQLTVEAMQRVIGVGHGDELHIAHFRAQVARDDKPANGQVRHAVEQQLFDAGQHLFAQAHPAATALGHKGGQRANEACAGVGGIHHQAHFGFPALLHVMGEVFQLAGVFHQLAGAAQQHFTGFGQHRLAPVDTQQGDAELVLHARYGVAH
ncbi:hypothetical protein PFLmoz3_03102 [Pseudomonas fluorescens]|uniref:Uncharacterized protein n=1 Tax=Pseudomonas fluorescens TaxID=294 RepID=A0A120G7H0_PSEFL|nr:hypothetical protein PFLmoz3_03102 [Pseudomonas fluorescens]